MLLVVCSHGLLVVSIYYYSIGEACAGKHLYADAVTQATKNSSFAKASPGNLGSHSIRKLSVTEARRRGVPADFVDYRARWKSKTMQGRYCHTQLNWPDVSAASKGLCPGGACRYVVKKDAGVTDEWLCTNVTPNISSTFGRVIGAILARPLLWAVYDVNWAERVSSEIRHRIISAFIKLEHFDTSEGSNPVDRIEIVASQSKPPFYPYSDRRPTVFVDTVNPVDLIHRLTLFCVPNINKSEEL